MGSAFGVFTILNKHNKTNNIYSRLSPEVLPIEGETPKGQRESLRKPSPRLNCPEVLPIEGEIPKGAEGV